VKKRTTGWLKRQALAILHEEKARVQERLLTLDEDSYDYIQARSELSRIWDEIERRTERVHDHRTQR